MEASFVNSGARPQAPSLKTGRHLKAASWVRTDSAEHKSDACAVRVHSYSAESNAVSRRVIVKRTFAAVYGVRLATLCSFSGKPSSNLSAKAVGGAREDEVGVHAMPVLALTSFRDRRGRFLLRYPESWFKFERTDGVVIGDFGSAIVLSVTFLRAEETLKELLLARTSSGNKEAIRAIDGGDRYIWKLARLSDVVTLVLAARDSNAATSAGKQVSTPTSVILVDSRQFLHRPSSSNDGSALVVDSSAVDSSAVNS
eukprot:CAMPEP_0185836744 /NCGR_PEP_ID=MMETSP1353-20130828/10237_1 /TAXON_ID=1077150 /ORGANISM="Erythrolobus australicus, Strain CCMP3124" /LENGTH=255 /DNA_ID=CAMNT_0028535571 /DNA_START=40 /DNA_END=804 /DNA_ORIENTATION=-